MTQPPPTDQKRLFMAVGLSAAVILVWTLVFPPQKPTPDPLAAGAAPAGSTTPGQPGTTSGSSAALPAGAAIQDALPAVAETTVLLEADARHTVAVSNLDGQIRHWDLLEEQYRAKIQGGTEPFRFVQPPAADHARGLFLPPDVQVLVGGQLVRGAYEVSLVGDEVVARFTDSVRKVQIERTYKTGAAAYTVAARIRVTNTGTAPQVFSLSARLRAAENAKEASAGFMAPPIYIFEGLCARGTDFERQGISTVQGNRADPESVPRFTDGLRYAGVDNRYFLSAVLPGAEGLSNCELFVGPDAAGVGVGQRAAETSYLVAVAELPGGSLAPGETAERSFQLYGGPKKLDTLGTLTPALSETVDFGLLTPLCLVMVSTLRFFHGLIPNWAIAIILLTVVVKVLTLPLTHKQYKSMAAMKLVQPELKALQEKHKDDKMRLQQEMMQLYKTHGINPVAGCLPLIAMMPVYIALYRTINFSVELYHAPLGLWIDDLSEMDPTFILPILLGVVFFIQARMNPPAGDAMQQRLMTTFMPILFTAMMLFLPSGLVVYILVNTLLGLAQQHYMMRLTPTPNPAPVPARGRS